MVKQFATGEVIRARIVKYPCIFHYGIAINCKDGCYIAHNPSTAKSGNPKPLLESVEDFFKNRTFEKSFGVLTNKNEDKLLAKFDEIKDKDYSFFLFNCEDFVNEMIDSFEFQRGKIQLGILVVSVAVLSFFIGRSVVKHFKK